MLRRALSSPLLYCGWAAFVVGTLVVTYPIDPYVFGIGALMLAWLTAVVAVAAIGAFALWAWDWTWPRRVLVVVGVAVAVFAVARALALLQTFSWA
jgi:hypothetical protein